MNPETSLWSFITDAGLVVKAVLLILFCASIASWTIIIQHMLIFKKNFSSIDKFEQRFWSGVDLNELFRQIANQGHLSGLSALFHAGFQEFRKLCMGANRHNVSAIIEGTKRAMNISQTRDLIRLEHGISFLATVGSISPYVGLFGTVWGIMTSFRAIGAVQQASIAMVAPGISEALIATAVGLFAAIPAVIAYNRFSNQLDRSAQQYEIFQEELITILHRNLLTSKETYVETL